MPRPRCAAGSSVASHSVNNALSRLSLLFTPILTLNLCLVNTFIGLGNDTYYSWHKHSTRPDYIAVDRYSLDAIKNSTVLKDEGYLLQLCRLPENQDHIPVFAEIDYAHKFSASKTSPKWDTVRLCTPQFHQSDVDIF